MRALFQISVLFLALGSLSPAPEVLEIKEHLNSHGINYLLNVGPDGLGRIPAPAIDILKEIGKKSK